MEGKDIISAGSHDSIDDLRRKAQQNPGQERVGPPGRSFHDIQKRLRELIDTPGTQEEKDLITERGALIERAKKIGVFKTLKDAMDTIQTYNDYYVARKMIFDIQVGNLELHARGINGWEDNFAGMIDEYKDVALLNMDHAMMTARGEGQSDEAKALMREINVRGWGIPPIHGLESMAKRTLEKEKGIKEEEGEHASVVQPEHIGAVFKDGRNIAYMTDLRGRLVQGIEAYDVRTEEGRRNWLFENLRAFNTLPLDQAGQNWKGAVNTYERDLMTAHNNIRKKMTNAREKRALDAEVEKTTLLLRSLMAVSASARSMERTAGVPDVYLRLISESRGEELDMDAQDHMGLYLLHNDPEKYLRVLNDPLVAHYYHQVLKDAHLMTSFGDATRADEDTELEWHKDKDGWHCSRVVLAESQGLGGIKDIRDKGRRNRDSLLYYFHGGAANGGFETYIKEVLLRRDGTFFNRGLNDNVRWAAARAACDLFLVDKFTRWDYQLTGLAPDGQHKMEKEIYRKPDLKSGKDKADILKAFPHKDWGGDPFRNILEPQHLPESIKGVYSGEEASAILDIAAAGFRPTDIFFPPELMERARNGDEKAKMDYDYLAGHILHPSAVEHFKMIGRYNVAWRAFFVSSRAVGVSESNMAVLRDSLKTIAEKFGELYGGIRLPSIGEEDDTGLHIAGKMWARVIRAKCAAARASLVNPSLFESLFGPTDSRSPQPMQELRESLFGSKFDWKSGLVADMASLRTQFVIKGNRFGAEQDLQAAYDDLASAEESMLVKLGKAAVIVSTGMTSKR